MATTTTTKYVILGTYRGKKEQIDHADDLRTALYLVGEYRLAYGSEWTVTYRRATKKEREE